MDTKAITQNVLKDAMMYYVYAELNKPFSSVIASKKYISESIGNRQSWFSEASKNYKDITTTSLIRLLESISEHGLPIGANGINVFNGDAFRIAKILRDYLSDSENISLVSMIESLDETDRATLEIPIFFQIGQFKRWLDKHPEGKNSAVIKEENELRSQIYSKLMDIKNKEANK